MLSTSKTFLTYFVAVSLYFIVHLSLATNSPLNKTLLKEQVLEMFHHAYWSYMNYAYPADELMPISCQGRYRGVTPCRGDVDDALGNFSLTLIDALDTLLVVGDYDEFERAVQLIVEEVHFDSDLVVSVFETNIRVVGGLLSGHIMAKHLQTASAGRLMWYTDQLLGMAREVAYRLLPAFNTTTGVPFPRVNLKYGLDGSAMFLRSQHDTCTACAGTMILEFATLSRLTGDGIFEAKARKAMDFLWQQRHRTSDLMGTVINVHSGDWIRRDSGVGAGIDSYYEYCLKAYILLGDESFLHRFNKHYSAVMKYVSQGPLLIDVHMHNPTVASKTFMDSLLAFWPGLQVLKGDLKPAIEIHEMLYQVTQRHSFLPEAFTHDFQVHWGQHPLRPEFVESTYFLYKATKDPHYLQVGKDILDSLNKHVRVKCGFAGVKDVRTMSHEDRMDSFFLAETFKYLFLLFAERDDLLFDVDNYIFTTEAHFMPLSVSSYIKYYGFRPGRVGAPTFETVDLDENFSRSCPNAKYLFKDELSLYAKVLRNRLKNYVYKLNPTNENAGNDRRLKPTDFNPSNPEHVYKLKKMGISLETHPDGKMQLIHSANQALTTRDAEEGFKFMQEMIKQMDDKMYITQMNQPARGVQLISSPYLGNVVLIASPAQFGKELTGDFNGVSAPLAVAEPYKACGDLTNKVELRGKVVLLERGDCMFIEKVRNVQIAGGVGAIIVDHVVGTSASKSALFAMSGDGSDDVTIPAVFLFHDEGERLLHLFASSQNLIVRVAELTKNPLRIFVDFLKTTTVPRSLFSLLKNRQPEDYFCYEHEKNVVCRKRPKGIERPPTLDQRMCVERKKQRQQDTEANTGNEKSKDEKRSNPILDIKVLPNGQKQLSFKFDNYLPSMMSTKQALGDEDKSELADALMDYLTLETNFDELLNSEEYRKVLKKLAFISMGDKLPLSKSEEQMIGAIADEIKVKENLDEVVEVKKKLFRRTAEKDEENIPGESAP